jgi:putative endonuclease
MLPRRLTEFPVIARSKATKQSIQPTDGRHQGWDRAGQSVQGGGAAPRNALSAKERQHLPREPCVYILANRRQGTLYTGVTSNLAERVFQHRQRLTPGFTSRYSCSRLVFYEKYERMDEAIAREKQIKGGSRARKIALIEAMNPDWQDLYNTLV